MRIARNRTDSPSASGPCDRHPVGRARFAELGRRDGPPVPVRLRGRVVLPLRPRGLREPFFLIPSTAAPFLPRARPGKTKNGLERADDAECFSDLLELVRVRRTQRWTRCPDLETEHLHGGLDR